MENLQYPCLSLELEGYQFNVSGMVNTDKEIVVGPFMTSHLSLLKRPEEDEIYKIARTFKSVKLYLDSMQSNTKRPAASAFPFVKNFRNSYGQLESLDYIEGLNRKVFIARRNNSDAKVVVKFASKYNDEIHRIYHKKGVSPELLCCEKMDDGFFLVVTEYIDAREVEPRDFEDESLCQQAKDFLSQSRDLNYVHGDLRPPNVLITNTDKKLQIIDFDWAGKHGITKYPLMINTTDIKWPEGVAPDEKMLMAHDEAWMKKLFKIM